MPRFLAATASTTTTQRGSFARTGHAIGGHLTPCALRLREPDCGDAISDVLMSPDGATACAPPLAFATALPDFHRIKRLDRRARDRAPPRRLSEAKTRTQDAFRRCDPRFCNQVSRFAFTVQDRAMTRTLSPVPGRRFVSGERLRYVLPGRSFSLPLGSPRMRLGRCFLPTSATDFHDEHPRTVRVLSARREPCRPRDLPTEIRRLPQRRAISSRSSTWPNLRWTRD
jgi:hypothetical protein